MLRLSPFSSSFFSSFHLFKDCVAAMTWNLLSFTKLSQFVEKAFIKLRHLCTPESFTAVVREALKISTDLFFWTQFVCYYVDQINIIYCLWEHALFVSVWVTPWRFSNSMCERLQLSLSVVWIQLFFCVSTLNTPRNLLFSMSDVIPIYIHDCCETKR